MRISDWSSDVCSSDLEGVTAIVGGRVESIAHWLTLVHPGDRPRMEKEVEAVLSGQHTQEVHYRARVLDGTERVLPQRAVVVAWAGARPARLAGTTADATALVHGTASEEHLSAGMPYAYLSDST